MAPDVAGKSATDLPQMLCGRQTLLWTCFGRLATIWPVLHDNYMGPTLKQEHFSRVFQGARSRGILALRLNATVEDQKRSAPTLGPGPSRPLALISVQYNKTDTAKMAGGET
jgi:hypothetical protein